MCRISVFVVLILFLNASVLVSGRRWFSGRTRTWGRRKYFSRPSYSHSLPSYSYTPIYIPPVYPSYNLSSLYNHPYPAHNFFLPTHHANSNLTLGTLNSWQLGSAFPRNLLAPIGYPKHNTSVANASLGLSDVDVNRYLAFLNSFPWNKTQPAGPPKHSINFTAAPLHNTGGSETVRPIGFNLPGLFPSGTSHSSGPIGAPKQSSPVGNAPSSNLGFSDVDENKHPAFLNSFPWNKTQSAGPSRHITNLTIAPSHNTGGSGQTGFNLSELFSSGTNHSSQPIGLPKQSSPVGNAPPSFGLDLTTVDANKHLAFLNSFPWNKTQSAAPPKHSTNLTTAPSYNAGRSETVRPTGFNVSGLLSSGSSHSSQPIKVPEQSFPIGNTPPFNIGLSEVGVNRQPDLFSLNKSQPVSPSKSSTNLTTASSHNTGGFGTGRPMDFNIPRESSSGPSHAPSIAEAKQSTPLGNAPPPYHLTYNTAGYGPPAGSYHPQDARGMTIINSMNNHQNYGGYSGYHYHTPVYTTDDTGRTTLGFFLGYSLGKITTPSYHYYNSYSDEAHTPRYDHYTVHHYYHNKKSIPKEAEIQPNAIVRCVGDSGAFCPANTTSLCTNNGAVMCVTSATSTVPCLNNQQINCIQSTVPCKENNGPECKQSAKDTASIAIPCISTAKIYGDIKNVNNSIVVSNSTILS